MQQAKIENAIRHARERDLQIQANGPNQPLVTKLVAAARLPETAIRRERGTEVPAKVNSTQGSLYAEA